MGKTDRVLNQDRAQELIDEIKRRDALLSDRNPHWSGTKEELTQALAKGEIVEGTIIFITNDEEVVTTHEITDVEWTEIIKPIPETKPDSGGGGHTIQNSEGTSLTQRSRMQFAGDLSTTDNDATSGDEKTVIAPHALTTDELNEIITPLPGQRKEGVVIDERGNEYVIGEYIQADGKKKPLYEKMYLNGPTTGDSVPLDSSFSDKVLICGSGSFTTSNGIAQTVPSNISVLDVRGGVLGCYFSSSLTLSRSAFVVRYIKNTDVAV